MSRLGDMMERFLEDRSPDLPVPTFVDTLRDAVISAGSNRALARRIGVSESTIRRWLKGTTPKAATRERFDTSLRDRSRHIQDRDIRVSIFKKERKRADRESVLGARNLKMVEGAAGRIRDAYVSGGKEAAARQFLAEVRDPWYRQHFEAGIDDSDTGDYYVSITAIG